jgi:hypothetical protein
MGVPSSQHTCDRMQTTKIRFIVNKIIRSTALWRHVISWWLWIVQKDTLLPTSLKSWIWSNKLSWHPPILQHDVMTHKLTILLEKKHPNLHIITCVSFPTTIFLNPLKSQWLLSVLPTSTLHTTLAHCMCSRIILGINFKYFLKQYWPTAFHNEHNAR